MSKRNSIERELEEVREQHRREPIERGPIERERAFGGAYRSYRINGIRRTDVDNFFSRTRRDLISLIARELNGLGSARVQTTTWIRFMHDFLSVVDG